MNKIIILSLFFYISPCNSANFPDKNLKSSINDASTYVPALKKVKPDDVIATPQSSEFLNSGFESLSYKIEPLPTLDINHENKNQSILITRFICLKHLKLLSDDESTSLFEQNSNVFSKFIAGDISLVHWKFAIGELDEINGNKLIFLVPPHMDIFKENDKLVVEVLEEGKINIARYILK